MSAPYWLDEPPPQLLGPTLSAGPDVVVVGAGITGCSAALTLARAGLRTLGSPTFESSAPLSGQRAMGRRMLEAALP